MRKLYCDLKNYFGKEVLSARYMVSMLVLALIVIMAFIEVPDVLVECGYRIGALEIATFIMSGGGISTVYYLVWVFVISGFPRWEGCQNEALRMGKTSWLNRQFLYIFLTAVIQFLVVTAAQIIAVCRAASWQNSWSQLSEYLCDGTVSLINLGSKIAVSFSYDVTGMGAPFEMFALSMALNVLCSVCIGCIVVVVNMCGRKGYGTAAGLFIVGLSSILYTLEPGSSAESMVRKIYNIVRYYLYPMAYTDLFRLTAKMGFNTVVWVVIGALYFLTIALAAYIAGRKFIKKVDLFLE